MGASAESESLPATGKSYLAAGNRISFEVSLCDASCQGTKICTKPRLAVASVGRTRFVFSGAVVLGNCKSGKGYVGLLLFSYWAEHAGF